MGETGWGAITEAVVRKTKVCKGRSELPYECRPGKWSADRSTGDADGSITHPGLLRRFIVFGSFVVENTFTPTFSPVF